MVEHREMESPKHQEESVEGKVKVYPNPASNQVTVGFDKTLGLEGEFQLFDLNGRLAKTFKVENGENKLILDGLPSGMYIAQLVCGHSIVLKTKLAVLR